MAKAVNAMSSLGWEMAPGPHRVSPHPRAGPTLRMARLGHLLKSRRRGTGASSEWNLPMTAPVFRGASHIGTGVSYVGTGVSYVRNQIHGCFFFNSEKKRSPFKK